MANTVEDDALDQAERAIEAIESSTPTRTIPMRLWHAESETFVEREYVQEELGFLPAQRFFTRVTREIKNFVKGEYGTTLGQLFSQATKARAEMPETVDAQALDKVVTQNEVVIKAFLDLVELVPEIQTDIIALSLGVPRREVDLFKDAIEEPPSRGGLTQAQGFEILRWFVRQNAVGLRRFFEEEATSLVKEVELYVIYKGDEKAMAKAKAKTKDISTPGGKPSSTTRQNTPKR